MQPTCPHCGRSFRFPSQLRTHLWNVRTPPQFKVLLRAVRLVNEAARRPPRSFYDQVRAAARAR